MFTRSIGQLIGEHCLYLNLTGCMDPTLFSFFMRSFNSEFKKIALHWKHVDPAFVNKKLEAACVETILTSNVAFHAKWIALSTRGILPQRTITHYKKWLYQPTSDGTIRVLQIYEAHVDVSYENKKEKRQLKNLFYNIIKVSDS